MQTIGSCPEFIWEGEVISYLAACMMLWFGFVTQTFLANLSLPIAKQCLHGIRAFFSLHTVCA